MRRGGKDDRWRTHESAQVGWGGGSQNRGMGQELLEWISRSGVSNMVLLRWYFRGAG